MYVYCEENGFRWCRVEGEELTDPVTGGALGHSLMLRIQRDARHSADETAEQTEGRKESQPDTGRKQKEVDPMENP